MNPPAFEKMIQFARGIPPAECIPSAALAQCAGQVLASNAPAAFQYAPLGAFQGLPRLREQLAAFNGVDPAQIFVGNGSLQVLGLAAGYLARAEGRHVAFVEAPSYDRAIRSFERAGAQVVGIPMDRDGIDIERLEAQVRPSDRAFLYTIPDFQNPTGISLSDEKRRALLGLAARHDITILEDIPYRELRYRGAVLSGLRSIESDARVITIGSLSKVLSPGLRIGYAIADAATAASLAIQAEDTYLSPAPLCQEIAAACLAAGELYSNIQRVRDLLRPRHDAAAASARRILGAALITVPNGGYFMGAYLAYPGGESAFIAAAREHGLQLTSGAAFYPGGASPQPGIHFVRLPFHLLDDNDFEKGCRILEGLARTGTARAA